MDSAGDVKLDLGKERADEYSSMNGSELPKLKMMNKRQNLHLEKKMDPENKKQKLDEPVNKVSDSDEFQISYEDTDERIGIKDKYSNFTRETASCVQVTKAQYTAEINEEEKNFYNSDDYKNFNHRGATDAELKQLIHAYYKSQGFDIPFLAGAINVPVHRVNLSCEPSAIKVARLSKCALRWYNRAKGTKYGLDCIVKATRKPCAYALFCITFMAKEKSAPAEIFQARVWVKFNFNVHICMCKKKDDPEPEPSKLVDLEIEDDYDEELVGFNSDDDDYDDDDDDEAPEDDDQPQAQRQEDDDQPQPQPQRQKDDDQPQAQVGQSL